MACIFFKTIIGILLVISLSCYAGIKSTSSQDSNAVKKHVQTGAEVLLQKYLSIIKDKRVGLVCNQTTVLPDGTHLVDTLRSLGITITALFGPEHGIRGTEAAGETFDNNRDKKTGIPIYSLYGKTKKPTPEMLKDVDILIFDIQDIGSRYYTYVSTMAYCMESAAENHKKFIVLDRPNPINGKNLEGTVLDPAFKSFIGMFPIPVRHGMTLGELAKMIVGEKWMDNIKDIDLTIITMDNWNRNLWFDETSLAWIPPSPNMKTLATATVYPGTCLFEGTNVSEGRGTDKPFEFIGAPWINADTLASTLNLEKHAGVKFENIEFTPRSDSIAAPNPKYKNVKCGGVFVHVTDRDKFQPFETAIAMLHAIHACYPEKFKISKDSFEHLIGINILDQQGNLDENIDLQHITDDINAFQAKRIKYLLY
ncbi:MAG: exo-beta-N-acetylmuramidase NamZ domain-containing protein [Bacteroidota bacterium]